MKVNWFINYASDVTISDVRYTRKLYHDIQHRTITIRYVTRYTHYNATFIMLIFK